MSKINFFILFLNICFKSEKLELILLNNNTNIIINKIKNTSLKYSTKLNAKKNIQKKESIYIYKNENKDSNDSSSFNIDNVEEDID